MINNLYILFHSSYTHLAIIQKLLGKWESLCLVSPFCKAFRWPMINFIKKFEDNADVMLPIPKNVKDDIRIWYSIVCAAVEGLPIAPRYCNIPLFTFNFVSDAAGRPPPGSKIKTGVATLGIHNDKAWFGCRLFWPVNFTLAVQNNTAVYELVGLVIPIVLNIQKIRYNHVVLNVDNQAIVWSWPKKQMKGDELASILLRVLSILEMYIPCMIHVQHMPRLSSPAAIVTDNLSRDSTSFSADIKLLTHTEDDLPASLRNWLNHPYANWNLGLELVTELSNK